MGVPDTAVVKSLGVLEIAIVKYLGVLEIAVVKSLVVLEIAIVKYLGVLDSLDVAVRPIDPYFHVCKNRQCLCNFLITFHTYKLYGYYG